MQEGHWIIIYCVLAYFLAFYFYRKQKFGSGVLFIIISAAIIRIYMGSHQFLMPWDERFHALVAKNMMDNPLKPVLLREPLLPYNHTDWSTNHIWLHKPPMTLWLITLSYFIFGVNEWALRFPSLVMSLLTIFLIYKIGQKLFSSKVGWLGAFCFSLVALPITVSAGITTCDHVDASFMGFIILGIYWGISAVQKNNRWYYVLAGMAMGFAILTKWLTGLIVIGVVGTYLLSQKNTPLLKKIISLSMMLLAAIIIFIPWQIFIFNEYPQEAAFESAYNSRHIFDSVEGHEGSPWFHIDELNYHFSPFFYVMFPLGILCMIRNKSGGKMWTMLAWIFVPLLFFSIVKTKMLSFCLFIYPAVAIVIGYGINELLLLKGWWRRMSLIPIFIFIGWASFHTYHFMKLGKPHLKDNGFVITAKWTDYIKNQDKPMMVKPTVVINTPFYIEWMYYSDECVAAYKTLPDSNEVDNLKSRGYRVLSYSIEHDAYLER